MSTTRDPDSSTCWSDLVDETRTSGLAETSPVLDEDTTPEDVISSLNTLSLNDDKSEAYTRVHQPAPRLNKSHGFMRFIVSLMFESRLHDYFCSRFEIKFLGKTTKKNKLH